MPLPTLVGTDVIQEMIDMAREAPEGCFVEVGVYKGGTAQFLLELATRQERKFYGYDTFTGIPFQGEFDWHKPGDFGDTNLDAVAAGLPGAVLVQGVFPASAVDMPTVAFAHLDCDQYQSIIDSVNYLLPRMAPGGTIWFDDYGLLPGATRAVQSLFPHERILGSKTHKAFVRF